MNVLVYGSKGWIGSQVCSHLHKIGATVHDGQSRVDDEINLEKEILVINPTHVMCYIGRTHGKIGDKVFNTIDYLEQEGKLVENIRDNLYGPLVLALICKKYGVHMSYLGTGCIFEYDGEHPYGEEKNGFTESDKPNFFGSSYSVVKGFTDRMVHLIGDSVLNLRIRMPITSSKNPRNFITKIVNYAKICSIPNSMTVLDEMIPIIVDMAQKKVTGTFNMVNPGLISHNEILAMYRGFVDPNFTWENFTVGEQNAILHAKRSNNYLDTSKLEELYPNVNNIKLAVMRVLQNYT
jgi:3,5-epimerase/4-reductase